MPKVIDIKIDSLKQKVSSVYNDKGAVTFIFSKPVKKDDVKKDGEDSKS